MLQAKYQKQSQQPTIALYRMSQRVWKYCEQLTSFSNITSILQKKIRIKAKHRMMHHLGWYLGDKDFP